MRILFTGGGTKGHFYPLIAVAEAVRELAQKNKISPLGLYFMSDDRYDVRALMENEMSFVKIGVPGKVPQSGFKKIGWYFRLAISLFEAVTTLYKIYPDVIFSGGGAPSFPVVVAGWILGIPVVLHEVNAVPGRVTLMSARFAKYISLGFKEAAPYFENVAPNAEIVHTGQPIRAGLIRKRTEGAAEILGVSKNLPVITFIGGSQGASIINEVVIDVLPRLLEKYQVVHVAGSKNYDGVKLETDVLLKDVNNPERYHLFDFLDTFHLSVVAGATSLFVSRSGGFLFEIANWGIPSILIPLKISYANHQRENAYAYANTGAAIVIEEDNLDGDVLLEQIKIILDNEEVYNKMAKAATKFSRPDARIKIASKLIDAAIKHE